MGSTVKEPKFKVGDVVRLYSGGPPMSIEEVHELTSLNTIISYACCWFDLKNKIRHAIFREEVLNGQ